MPDLQTINRLFAEKQSKDPGWINRITIQQRNKLAEEYRTAYRAIDSQLASLYQKYDTLTYGEMVKFNRLNRLNRSIFNQIKSIDPNIRNIIYEDIKLEYAEAYYRKGYGFETSLEATIDFEKLSPKQIEAGLYKEYNFQTVKESLKSNTARINANVQHNISQGLIQGHSYGKMANGVRDSFNRGFNDAYRIMRTEGHRAREIGNMDSADFARKKGLDVREIWSAVFDERTRSMHGDADGREKDKEGYFNLPGGVRAIAPGLTGYAEHDINCRCTVTHKIKNFRSNYKRVKGVGIVDRNTAYKAWKEIKKIKT